jgi:hypothetical protein
MKTCVHFMIMSVWILLRIRNISDKSRENKNSHFMFNNFFPKCRLWASREEYDTGRQTTDDNVIWLREDAIFMPGN